MSFFSPTTAAPAPAPSAPAPTPQQQQQTKDGANPNPATPGPMEGTKQEPVNSLDAYNKLWDNSTTPADKAPSFNIDPKVLGDAAGSMNFTQGIPPDLMAKATSGDANALVEIINLAARQAYQSSLSHSSALTDRFVAARSEFDMKGINSKVTQSLTSSALADSPNYDHPVVKAEFNRVANAFQAQNPDATPAQIVAQTKKYMTDMQEALNPTAKSKEAEANKPTNWSEWMNS
jgi:hypothetical protein